MSRQGCFHCSRPPELVGECLSELADGATDGEASSCFHDASVLSRSSESLDGSIGNQSLAFSLSIPEGFKAGDLFTFHTPDGTAWKLRVPAGKLAGETLEVKLPKPQKVPVIVPKGKKCGDSFKFVGPDDKVHVATVPSGVRAGEAFNANLYHNPPRHGIGLEEPEMLAWLDAARGFTMNSEFDLASSMGAPIPNLTRLIAEMCAKPGGGITLQALSDKLTMSQLLGNLDLPSMPTLLAITDPKTIPEEIGRFVDHCISGDNKSDMVLKPTHISNGQGVLMLKNCVREDSRDITVQSLERHLREFWRQPPEAELSGRALRPGFLFQPQYETLLGFPTPLELRVVAFWGKARMGVWWWGTLEGPSPQMAHRNTWIVRRIKRLGRLSHDDGWEALHRHSGSNPDFHAAHKLLLHHMPAMARMTEHVALAVGAPFLRADFFVGSPQWGLRMNSVVLGSGMEYRRKRRPWGSQAQDAPLVDDAPAMAQILVRGMQKVRERKPASHFLSKLGICGNSYEEMTVDVVLPSQRLQLPGSLTLSAGIDDEDHDVPPEVSSTPRLSVVPATGASQRSPSHFSDAGFEMTSIPSSSANSSGALPICRKLNFQALDAREASASPPASPSASSQSPSTPPRIGGVHCFALPEVRDKLPQKQASPPPPPPPPTSTLPRGRISL